MLLLFRSSVPEELTGPEGSPQVTEGGAGLELPLLKFALPTCTALLDCSEIGCLRVGFLLHSTHFSRRAA